MAIIYTYPEINQVEGGDLLLISDTSLHKRPTRSVTVNDLAAYIGTVVGVVQNLQSVLTVGNTYVSSDGYGTFTLNDITNNNGNIKYVNTDEGWGYALNAEEGLYFTDGAGSSTGFTSINRNRISIGNDNYIGEISSSSITANRTYALPNASGTLALTSDIPSPGPGGSGTTNYTARWTNASTLGIGTLYDNGTNVGIGINGTYTDPPQRLTVVSDDDIQPVVQFKNIGNGGGLFVRTDSTTRPLLQLFSGSSYRFVVTGTGNVGIGTTSPDYLFEVEKTTSGSATLASFKNTENTGIRISRTGTSPGTSIFNVVNNGALYTSSDSHIAFQPGNSTSVFMQSTGNVGIGTTNPTANLQLGAFGTANQEFRIESSGNSYFSVLTTDGVQKIYAGGAGTQSNEIAFYTSNSGAEGERIRITSSGNVGIGTTSPSSKFQVSVNDGDGITLKHGASNAFYILRDGSDDTIIKQTRNYTSKISISTLADSGTHESSGLNIVGQGVGLKSNVGIGTASPSEKLEVSGNVKVDKGSAPGRTAYLSDDGLYIGRLSAYGGGYPNNIIADPSNSNNLDINARARISLKLNTSTVLVANDSGNVGIGTTSPSEKLEVSGKAIIRKSGSATAHADTDLLVTDATAASSTAAIEILGGNAGHSNIKFADTDSYTSGSIDYNHSSNSMTFRTNNSQNVIINSLGNVGIGTTSPAEKLHVNGEVRVDGNDGVATKKVRSSYFSSSQNLDLQSGSSADIILTSDKVGIGTTSPTDKLDVRGNVHIEASSPSITLKNNVGFAQDYSITNSGDLTIEKNGLDGGGSFIIKDEHDKTPLQVSMGLISPNVIVSGDLYAKNKEGTTTNLFIVGGNGNVGIGTTSPLSKLNVNGDIKIEGENELYFGSSGSVPLWEIKASGSDLVINNTATNVGSVLFNNDEGIVLPRLTTTEINAISLPNTGLTVYNTTLNTLCFYNGSSWQKVSHTNM